MKKKLPSYIHDLLSSTTYVAVPNNLEKLIQEQSLNTKAWLCKSIKLGLMLEDLIVLQKVGVGEEMLLLKMIDITPYLVASLQEAKNINVPQSFVNKIDEKLGITANPKNRKLWLRKAIFLGVNHKGMDLYEKENDVYKRIDFNSIKVLNYTK